MSGRVAAAIAEAEGVFWEAVAEHFPEIESGDFSPEQLADWSAATRRAVDAWVENNKRRDEDD